MIQRVGGFGEGVTGHPEALSRLDDGGQGLIFSFRCDVAIDPNINIYMYPLS